MSVDEAIRIFRYTPAWRLSGFVSDELLERQYRFWQTGEDDNDEHYRYGACKEWLAARDSMTDAELTAWLGIIRDDPDQSMAGAMLGELAAASWVTDSQFDAFYDAALVLGTNGLIKHLERVRLRRLGRP